ncbi:mucin-5AC [Ixodes scapularis]|uniref:mucin-5AC n=1 Tax=Ixodes scapularis TaxID=6945 RepID=UPI001A9F7E1F|nr:mucin-5AC [Ixodes scapularis]
MRLGARKQADGTASAASAGRRGRSLSAATERPGLCGPALDHTAQKDRGLLALRGSLSRRRRPTRSSLHALLAAVHWTPTPATPSGPEVAQGPQDPSAALAADDTAAGADRRPTTVGTAVDTVVPAPERHDTPKPFSERDSEPARFIHDATPPSSEAEVPGADIDDDVASKTGSRGRRASLDSGCSLDMSCSSGSGTPDPPSSTPTVTPPPEFADTPIAERRRRSRRRTATDAIVAPAVFPPTKTQIATMAPTPRGFPPRSPQGPPVSPAKKPSGIPRPRTPDAPAAPSKTSAPSDFRVNFRIVPRGEPRGRGTAQQSKPAAASSHGVSRSESCRTARVHGAGRGGVGGGVLPTSSLSWDRKMLTSPSDRYLDDAERRCRSLSRSGRPPSEHQVDPEWLEIARRRKAAGVDWENLEAKMKEPQSISCSNLSESHMLGRVSSLASADRLGLRLVRSASALYPRIKMSRYERRLRRDNRNPSPDRRRSSDEFCVVSSDGTSPAASSSTEDEKPSFLNVQLRHVERAPPLNVVFQTSGSRAEAPPASPSLTWKSHREVAEPRTLPPPRSQTARGRSVSETIGPAEFLLPKPVELIESTPSKTTDRSADIKRRVVKNESFSEVQRKAGRTQLKRSASVQMRTGGTTSAAAGTHAPSPWPPVDGLSSAEDLPSWIREAERKRNCDKSLSQASDGRATYLSSECLHQPTSESEVPDWLKEIRRKREEDARLRLSKSSDDILNEANVIDSATPLVRPGSPAEITADSPRPVEPSEEEKEMQNTGLPTPPPMPPSDFWKKPSQERWSKPDAARRTRAIPVLTPTCHRDHGTQTATPDAVAPVLTQASVVHHMTPVTYTHQFVSSGPSPVLLLPHVDDTPLQPRPFYAMPVCQPVFARTAVTSGATPLYPNTTFVMSGCEELTRTPSEPKKIVTASKSTWTESGVTATPTPGMGDETKALLDEFGKCLEEDRAARAPSDLSRPRTATPVKSKITVETTTILQTVESSTRLIRGADQTSIKSICGNSEKGDILSNLSDSPIPFADDDDVMEELGFSSHCESRSASQNGIKRDIVTDEHLTVYTTTKKAAETPKDSTPQPSTSKQDEDVRSAFSPPPSRIQMTSPSASRSQIPVASRSPTPEKTFKANGDIHGELPRKSRPSGVTVLSASKGDSINSKFQRGPCPSPGQSSTVTTGPGGTVRGNHSRPFLHSATTDSAAGDLSNLDDVFRKTKSISVPNLLTTGREKSFAKKVVSQSTQTPNGLVTVDKCRVHGGRVAGAQTEDRLDSFLRDTLRKSTKEVEFVTKVDSSQPSKTLRKKVTTKILRGTSGKNGDVREVIEEFYDQSSLVLRPSNGIKNVTRSVRQASDGHKYLTTVITEAPAAGLSRRNRRRGFGDPDGHVIMV